MMCYEIFPYSLTTELSRVKQETHSLGGNISFSFSFFYWVFPIILITDGIQIENCCSIKYKKILSAYC